MEDSTADGYDIAIHCACDFFDRPSTFFVYVNVINMTIIYRKRWGDNAETEELPPKVTITDRQIGAASQQ